MTPEQIEQILDMLVEKLGPIGEHVWSVFVRQVYVEAIFEGVIGILFLLAALGFLAGGVWSAKRYAKAKAESSCYDAGDYSLFGGILPCVLLGSLTFMLAVACLSGLVRLFNVEYYAIQMLLGR